MEGWLSVEGRGPQEERSPKKNGKRMDKEWTNKKLKTKIK